eukprot:5227768-Pyramimonas_sp.AAC.1
MGRALSAGYDSPQGCTCGHDKDDLQHCLLECHKTGQAGEEFTSGELRRLKDPIPDTSPPLHLGFQCAPNFVDNTPPWHWPGGR